METVSRATAKGWVGGSIDPKFAGVLDAFIENFERREEVGASVAITLEGRMVVDLWGGLRTLAGVPWTRDTVSILHSATKGACSLCAHIAADRGLLDLDAKVTDYWPEYGVNGKQDTLVAMMLDHTAGVPHVRSPIEPGGMFDYDYMCALVAAEAPFWTPGRRVGYHAFTFAWTVGGLVHRATHTRTGRFFAEEVAKPLGIDFWIGLPEELESRVAPIIAAAVPDAARSSPMAQAMAAEPDGITALFLFNNGGLDLNTRESHAAEFASGNGISNGRGLAGLYAPLANGGTWNGVHLVSEDTTTRMGRVAAATHYDETLAMPTRFALGFMKSMDNRRLGNAANCSAILSEPAFGHVGAGGSIGFADPEAKMSFGYTMNQMGYGILLNERGQSLVDAAYTALGYRSNAGGAWAH